MFRRRAIFAPSGRTLFYASGDLKVGAACLRHVDRSQELLNRHAFGPKGPAAICELGTYPHAAAAWDLNVENDLHVGNTGREPLGKARLNRTFRGYRVTRRKDLSPRYPSAMCHLGDRDIRLVEYRTFDRPSALNQATRPGAGVHRENGDSVCALPNTTLAERVCRNLF